MNKLTKILCITFTQMKIKKGNDYQEIIAIKYIKIPIIKLLLGTKVIWSLIKSCFGSGTWTNSGDWVNSDTWKN